MDNIELNKKLLDIMTQSLKEGGECYQCDGKDPDCPQCKGSGYVQYDDDPNEPSQEEMDKHAKKESAPYGEPSQEEEMYNTLITAYENGEGDLAEVMGMSIEELDQEMSEYARDHNLHMDDDRDEVVQGYIEDVVHNADFKDHGEYESVEEEEESLEDKLKGAIEGTQYMIDEYEKKRVELESDPEFQQADEDEQDGWMWDVQDGVNVVDEEHKLEFFQRALEDHQKNGTTHWWQGEFVSTDTAVRDEIASELQDMGAWRGDLEEAPVEEGLEELAMPCGADAEPQVEQSVEFRQHKNTDRGSVTIEASADDMQELAKVLKLAGLTLPKDMNYDQDPIQPASDDPVVVVPDAEDGDKPTMNFPKTDVDPNMSQDKAVLTSVIRDKLRDYLKNSQR